MIYWSIGAWFLWTNFHWADKADKISLESHLICQLRSAVSCWVLTCEKMEQEETISTLNIYVASHSVLRHDIQPESRIKCGHISLTHAAERTSSGQQMDMNMKRIRCWRNKNPLWWGCLKNWCSSPSSKAGSLLKWSWAEQFERRSLPKG